MCFVQSQYKGNHKGEAAFAHRRKSEGVLLQTSFLEHGRGIPGIPGRCVSGQQKSGKTSVAPKQALWNTPAESAESMEGVSVSKNEGELLHNKLFGTRPRNPQNPWNPRKWCHDLLLGTSPTRAGGQDDVSSQATSLKLI